MVERPHPSGIEAKRDAVRGLVHRAMREHPDEDIRKFWRGGFEKGSAQQNILCTMQAAVVDGIALSIASKTRSELMEHTQAALDSQEQKMTKHKRRGPFARAAFKELTEIVAAPPSRINPEKADLDLRITIAQGLAKLTFLNYPKAIGVQGISLEERVKFIAQLTEVATHTALKKRRADRTEAASS